MKVPFYKKIVFKAMVLVTIVLAFGFFMSIEIMQKQLEERMSQKLSQDFISAQHTTENFITFMGQASQMWAKEIAYDGNFHTKIKEKNYDEISKIISVDKRKISADTIIVLDKNGFVLAQKGSIYRAGDSLKYYDIVKETLKTKNPITKMAREKESFIIYSSSVIEEDNQMLGVLLVGYFVNDIFLENIKANTSLEIAFIGNSAVMSSTKWGGVENLAILPINYLVYQNLLKDNKKFQEIKHNGKIYKVSAKKLRNIESLTSGSILFGYEFDWVKKQEAKIIQEHIKLLGIIYLISTLIISFFVLKYSKALGKLNQATLKLANRKSYEKVNIDSNDELELLANNFNLMAVELNNLHNGMEAEIEDKTKELNNLNANLKIRVKDEVEKNREKDKKMIYQSRLAQMGEMLSMIAHQWRQPLNAISVTCVNLNIKARLDNINSETVIKEADNISGFVQHLSATINDFRDFFKTNKKRQEIDYDQLVTAVLTIIQHSLMGKNIELIKDFQLEEKFESHPNEVKQVILNLIKNSEDILVEKKIKDAYIKVSTFKDGESYILEVSDNGGGVPEGIIEKVFDPYFSTKLKKDGTGLGLYMSKTIIEEHCGGKLTVSNNKDGAVFRISLI